MIYGIISCSLVGIEFNLNGIMLMILMVVASIFNFVKYYIRDDVSSENFKLLKLMFVGLIILILTSYKMVMFIG